MRKLGRLGKLEQLGKFGRRLLGSKSFEGREIGLYGKLSLPDFGKPLMPFGDFEARFLQKLRCGFNPVEEERGVLGWRTFPLPYTGPIGISSIGCEVWG